MPTANIGNPNSKWWKSHFPERDWPITQSVMEAIGDSFLPGPTELDKLQPSGLISTDLLIRPGSLAIRWGLNHFSCY